ncbi:MAG: hypothetical protein WKF97_04595 [Chitinophagaceae bacterium]
MTFPLWATLIFACAAIVGLIGLVKSVSRMLAVYNNPHRVECSAREHLNIVTLNQPGMYEIAVKRPYLLGPISGSAFFRLVDLDNNLEIPVEQNLNLLGQRKNMSGDRIVPISQFNINKTGSYQLHNSNPEKYKDRDRFVITPQTGHKGIVLVFAIVGSGILFIGGAVMLLISFIHADG